MKPEQSKVDSDREKKEMKADLLKLMTDAFNLGEKRGIRKGMERAARMLDNSNYGKVAAGIILTAARELK